MNPFLTQTAALLARVDQSEIDHTLDQLRQLRDRPGRLFLIGNGGGAGHASHAAADFRKIGRVEAYAWGDNVSDLTAWVNDTTWEAAIANWLEGSHYCRDDALFVFSVGGASDTVSTNLKWAMSYAATTTILGIVGAAGGEVARYGKPIIIPSTSTPQVEGIQSVLWHHLVTELT